MYKSQKNFIRYVSHEVRTPLNTLSTGLDLLLAHEIFHLFRQDTISSDMKQSLIKNPLSFTSAMIIENQPIQNGEYSDLAEKKMNFDISQNHENYQKRLAVMNDALEILESMRQSCETAVCTLNDVLLYDKIEGGTMVLEKRKISVIDLLHQTIKPFYIQVYSHGVYLSDLLILLGSFQ